MNELDEILDIVDENNEVVGQTTRGECYKKGLLHRAVNIFIFNSKGEVFLHKRSNKKLKYPGAWDMSSSEHVRARESFDQAVKRGLKEELGIKVSLKLIIPIHRIDSGYQSKKDTYLDNELIQTYKGIYDGEMNFDPNEIADGKFFTVEEVNQMIADKKIQFTPWFLKDWELVDF